MSTSDSDERLPLVGSQTPETFRQRTWRLSSMNRKAPRLKKWVLAYYIPSLAWIEHYEAKNLAGDIFAGLTLASFQIPVTLSYATSLAHLPSSSGLLGLIVQPIVYALLGTVPCMVVAPEAAISLILGQVADHYNHDGPSDDRGNLIATQVASLLTGMVGFIVLSMGLLRMGFMEQVMSASMLRGFVTGLAFVIIIDQLPQQLKIHDIMKRKLGSHATPIEKFFWIAENLYRTHIPTAVFAFSGLAVMLVLKYIKRSQIKRGRDRWILLPEILLVILLSLVISKVLDVESMGVPVVGTVGVGHVEFSWMLRPKYWKDFKLNFSTAFFMGFLGFLESSVASRSFPAPEYSTISSNRELVAFGVANILGMTVSALPVFGGYGRSKINVLSGAKSQLSQIVAAIVTLFVAIYLMQYVYFLPKGILSSVVTTIGVALLEEVPKDISYYISVGGWSDLFTIGATCVMTLLWSIEAGVATGAFFAFLRVIRHATRPRIQILTRLSGTHEYVNADDMEAFPENTHSLESGVLIIKVPEPLTFANSGELKSRLRRLEMHGTNKVHPGRPRRIAGGGLHHVIFNIDGMTECDAQGARILRDIVSNYIERDITVFFSEVSNRQEIQDLLRNAGIVEMLNHQNTRQTIFTKLEYAISSIEDSTI